MEEDVSTNIREFPATKWQRIWNTRGTKAVSCVVSERWLKFGKIGVASDGYLPAMRIGTPVSVSVMTDPDGEGNDRKLCSLMVTYEELKRVMDQLEREIAAAGGSHR